MSSKLANCQLGETSFSDFYMNKVSVFGDNANLLAAMMKHSPKCPNLRLPEQADDTEYSGAYRYVLSEDQHHAMTRVIGEEYRIFVALVEQMLFNPLLVLSNPSTDITHDFILYDCIRMIIPKGHYQPDIYLKINKALIGSAGNLNEDWRKCEETDYAMINLLKYGYKAHTGYYTPPYASLFMIATWRIFQTTHDLSSRIYSAYFNEMYGMEKVLNQITEIHPQRHISLGFGFPPTEEISAISKTAAILSRLYYEDRHTVTSGKHIEYAEQALEQVRHQIQDVLIGEKLHYFHKIYLSDVPKDTLINDIRFLCFYDKNSSALERWHSECPAKALYLTGVFRHAPNDAINRLGSDFFSYQNLVGKLGNYEYGFSNKAEVRRFFSLNEEQLCAVWGKNNYTSTNATVWEMILYWLTRSRMVKNPNPEIIKMMWFDVQNHVRYWDDELKAVLPYALDLIYAYIDEHKLYESENPNADRNLNMVLDYLNTQGIFQDANGEYHKTANKNILQVHKKSTFQSLIRKSEEWHELSAMERQYQYLRRAQNVENVVFEHLNPITTEINEFECELIHDRKTLLLESVVMQHCVDTYFERIQDGAYVVFKITMKGRSLFNPSTRATLGIIVKNGTLQLHQCQSVRNRPISNAINKVAHTLVEMLNNGDLKLYAKQEKKALCD